MFDDLRQEMNELMEQFLPLPLEADGQRRGWCAARPDVIESDKDYEIVVDLPGMKPDDFNVEVRGGNVRISAERKCARPPEGKKYRQIGCHYGAFEEVVGLDVPVKADKVQADYKDGVLRVTIPKEESAKPRRIAVTSS
jgi:HSP20 family protein